jgi:hypothetical protein
MENGMNYNCRLLNKNTIAFRIEFSIILEIIASKLSFGKD